MKKCIDEFCPDIWTNKRVIFLGHPVNNIISCIMLLCSSPHVTKSKVPSLSLSWPWQSTTEQSSLHTTSRTPSSEPGQPIRGQHGPELTNGRPGNVCCQNKTVSLSIRECTKPIRGQLQKRLPSRNYMTSTCENRFCLPFHILSTILLHKI